MSKNGKTEEKTTEAVETISGALSPIQEGPRDLQSLAKPEWSHAKSCNFDCSTDEGFSRILTMGNAGSPKLSSLGTKIFQLVHWACEHSVYTQDDGEEPVPGVRLALWNEKDELFITSSEAVVRQMDRIITFKGRGPYNPPLKLRFTQVDTAGGRRTYSVELVFK